MGTVVETLSLKNVVETLSLKHVVETCRWNTVVEPVLSTCRWNTVVEWLHAHSRTLTSCANIQNAHPAQKSASTALPSRAKRIFSTLTWRCTMPRPWMLSKALNKHRVTVLLRASLNKWGHLRKFVAWFGHIEYQVSMSSALAPTPRQRPTWHLVNPIPLGNVSARPPLFTTQVSISFPSKHYQHFSPIASYWKK